MDVSDATFQFFQLGEFVSFCFVFSMTPRSAEAFAVWTELGELVFKLFKLALQVFTSLRVFGLS